MDSSTDDADNGQMNISEIRAKSLHAKQSFLIPCIQDHQPFSADSIGVH